MTRRTSSMDQATAKRLAIPAMDDRRIENVRKNRLTPLPGVTEEQEKTHYRLLVEIGGSGKGSADVTALALAEAGLPCERIVEAVARIADIGDDRPSDDESAREQAEKIVDVALNEKRPPVWAKQGLDTLERHSLDAENFGCSEEDREDEAYVRMIAALTEWFEAMCTGKIDDPEDVMAITGLPAKLLPVLNTIVMSWKGRSPLAVGMMALQSATPETVVAAVRIAAACGPLLGSLGLKLPDRERRMALARSVLLVMPLVGPLLGFLAAQRAQTLDQYTSDVVGALGTGLNPTEVIDGLKSVATRGHLPASLPRPAA